MCIAYHQTEKDIAEAFKRMLEFALRGQIIIRPIEFNTWERDEMLPQTTRDAMGVSRALVVFVSPDSCDSKMLALLTGLAWGTNVTPFTLCHSGFSPEKLPFPLKLFCAVKASDFASLNSMMPPLGDALGIGTPRVHSADFIHNVEVYEHSHYFWATCNKAFNFIGKHGEHAIKELCELQPTIIEMSEQESQIFEEWLPFLKEQRLLEMSEMGYVSLQRNGIFRKYTLSPLCSLNQPLKNPKLLATQEINKKRKQQEQFSE